jgi:hypothetical protein
LYDHRYTTFIQPPAAKDREEHILPTLIAVIREQSSPSVSLGSTGIGGGGAGGSGANGGNNAFRPTNVMMVDSRLKRRCVAALGETVLYIAAQGNEDDDNEELENRNINNNNGKLLLLNIALIGCIYN